jgi:hypothetical protein
MFRSSVSDPAFRAAIWPNSAGSNARRGPKLVFALSAIPLRLAAKVSKAGAPRSFFASELQWASGRNPMLTFRIAITAAVMAFITALTACAAMDAASANTLSRLEAEVSELGTLIHVLSSNPSLADSDDRSEFGPAIVLFEAALRELPQADSPLCRLRQRLLVASPAPRRPRPDGAPEAGGTPRGHLQYQFGPPDLRQSPSDRRIFEDEEGNKIEQLDIWDYGYDARTRAGIAIRCRRTGLSFHLRIPRSASAHR